VSVFVSGKEMSKSQPLLPDPSPGYGMYSLLISYDIKVFFCKCYWCCAISNC